VTSLKAKNTRIAGKCDYIQKEHQSTSFKDLREMKIKKILQLLHGDGHGKCQQTIKYVRQEKTDVNNKTCWTEILPVILLLDHVTSQTTLPILLRYAHYSPVEKTVSEWMRTLSGV
jgi:hypothetical protein